jgi:hypothetical protein
MFNDAQVNCPLCAGHMVLEKGTHFRIAFGRTPLSAWVCTRCSAAFPIAVAAARTKTGSYEPLYVNGRRFDKR